jgi:hypothetical protein
MIGHLSTAIDPLSRCAARENFPYTFSFETWLSVKAALQVTSVHFRTAPNSFVLVLPTPRLQKYYNPSAPPLVGLNQMNRQARTTKETHTREFFQA